MSSNKIQPSSRLRRTRRRKNVKLTSPDPNSNHPSTSSSGDRFSEKIRVLPDYLTVDDLAAYRRKKNSDCNLINGTLQPLPGKFSGLKSEYNRRFRSHTVGPTDDTMNKWVLRKRKSREDEEALKSQGQIDFSSEYFSEYIIYPIGKRVVIKKPQDNLKYSSEPNLDTLTEHKEKYVMYKEARRALIVKRPTTLKVEGDFEVKETEYHENFQKFPKIEKSLLIRRNTILKPEGEMELTTEQLEKYKLHTNVPRLSLLRRGSNLRIPEGEFNGISEQRSRFTYGENISICKSMENLHVVEGAEGQGGDLENQLINVEGGNEKSEEENKNEGQSPTDMEILNNRDLENLEKFENKFSNQDFSEKIKLKKSELFSTPLERSDFGNYTKNEKTQKDDVQLVSPSSNLERKLSPYSKNSKSCTPKWEEDSKNKTQHKRELMSSPRKHNNNINTLLSPPENAFCVLEASRFNEPQKENGYGSTSSQRLPDSSFKRGKRYSQQKSPTSINKPHPFRLEVSNPDKADDTPITGWKSNRSFVVMEDQNRWIQNKQRNLKKVSNQLPSWARI